MMDTKILVREAAAYHLRLLYAIDKCRALQIAKKALIDVVTVRDSLIFGFLRYFYSNDKRNCLEFCKICINRQNSESIERDDILQYLIDIVCDGALKLDNLSYKTSLWKLILTKSFKGNVKECISFSCQKLFLETKLDYKILEIYNQLVLHSPKKSKPRIGIDLLGSLGRSISNLPGSISNLRVKWWWQ